MFRIQLVPDSVRKTRLTTGRRGGELAEAPNDYDKRTLPRKKYTYVYKKIVQYNCITTKQTLLIKVISNISEHSTALEETPSILYKYIWQKINHTKDSIQLGRLLKISVRTIVWLKSVQKQTHRDPHRAPSSEVHYHLASALPFYFVTCYCIICIWGFMVCIVL